MIVVKTKMKKMPAKCSNCKLSAYHYGQKVCLVTSDRDGFKQIPRVWVEEKKNYCYLIPDWCPLCNLEDLVGGECK